VATSRHPARPPTASTEPGAPATSTEAPDPDYKSLYEQAQIKLTRAEQTAMDHRAKAAKLDELEGAQQSEAEKASARASPAEAQVTALRRQAVDAEIRAAASGWADPTDAPRYIEDKDRYVGEDGQIDTVAIGTVLAAVLLARPHLARRNGPTPGRRPAPDPSQGPGSLAPPATTRRSLKLRRTATGPPLACCSTKAPPCRHPTKRSSVPPEQQWTS
jgi:hypothetical protein